MKYIVFILFVSFNIEALALDYIASLYDLSKRDFCSSRVFGLINAFHNGEIADGADIIKVSSDSGNKNIYLLGSKKWENLGTPIKRKIEPNVALEIKKLYKPAPYDTVKKNSDEFELYIRAIERDKRDVGRIYNIKIAGENSNYINLSLFIKEKFYAFQRSANFFSEDEVNIVYSDDVILNFSNKIKLGTTYIILEECIANVYDKVPFWGDVPLIGRFFRTEGKSKSIRAICAIEITKE